MTVRDAYMAFLEKKAASEGDTLHEAIPPNDSEQTASQEHARNQEDHRAYLHSIFSNADAVQNNQSADIRKLFDNIPKDITSSNPLLKVAFREVFFGALPNGNFLKTASPVHIEVAFNAFFDELEKIAMSMPTSIKSGQASSSRF